MRKIMTLGLTALTASTVLAFGSPIAAHAATHTQDYCTSTETTRNTLNSQYTNAVTDFEAARTDVATKLTLLTTATTNAANAVPPYLTALDTSGDTTTTKTNLDNSSAAFATAASNWLNAHIVAVGKRNFTTGTIFLYNYVVAAENAACGTTNVPKTLPVEAPL